MLKIVVDIYGADAGISPVVCGVAKALNQGIEFFPILVGEAKAITELMDEAGIARDRYEIVDTDQFIRQDEPANCIFGGRDDSSMAMALARLKSDPECQAMLSAGSTGALVVGSICRLGLLPGLKTPALLSALPCLGPDRLLCLIDCGANVECTPKDLVRFAIMGDVFCKCYCKLPAPRVGLMSVGRESTKGNALTREAHALIRELPMNFVGNLEGGDMVSGYADVIVADGYAGNLLLKCAEASGKAAMEMVKELGKDADPQVIESIANAIWKRFDFNSQGAATFMGTRKTIVKMHGCANADTTVSSILQIQRLENAGFIDALTAALAK